MSISLAQFSWKPLPAFSVSARKMTRARSWRWTLPYLSFLRIAREASCKVSAARVYAGTIGADAGLDHQCVRQNITQVTGTCPTLSSNRYTACIRRLLPPSSDSPPVLVHHIFHGHVKQDIPESH